MTENFYPIVVAALSEEDGGGFIAHVPDLYGCMGDGATPEEAVSDARSAIKEWCAEMRRLGRDVPAPGSCQEHFRAERMKIRELIEALVVEVRHVVDVQTRLIDAKEKEIERLLATISDLQSELRVLEDETAGGTARVLAWVRTAPAAIPSERNRPSRNH